MAKQISILMISLALLIFGGVYEIRYLENTEKYIKTDISYVQNALENDDFESAKKHIQEIRKTWGDVSDVWNIFVNHERIDDFEEAIEELNANIELRDKEEAIKKSMILKAILSQIVDKQRCSMEHVL